jgi:hypothetical protein
MKYEFEKVIDGLSKYINDEIYAGMNDLQEFAARVMVGRIINNRENVKEILINNGFIRTFGIIDAEGMVDVESLANDIKREIARKEKITFNVPMFGRMTFKPSDVDMLYKDITGEELTNNESN